MRTSLLRKNNARAYMQFLKDTDIPFTMICSNYTVAFVAEGLERKFVNSMQSNRTFAAYSKLKSDVSKKPVPKINLEKIVYFIHDFKKTERIGDVTNIDLKSAYATVLYKDGVISKDTYDYISALKKQERLAAVGMLAARKKIFNFDTGKVISYSEKVSETSNFFFFAVKRTGEIMNDIRGICGDNYLFTWVDGIYFKPCPEIQKRISDYIEKIGFKYSVDHLRNFNVTVDDKRVKVDFDKLEKDGVTWKNKPFQLPLEASAFKKLMIEAILSKHKK